MTDQPLDILVLTPWFPNTSGGWPAPFIADSCSALVRQGHAVRIAVLRGFVPGFLERFAPREHRGRIDVEAFPEFDSLTTHRHLALPGGRLRTWANRALDRAVRRAVSKAIRMKRPDIVIVHTEGIAPGALPVVQALGVPALVVLHGENTNDAYISCPGQAARFRAPLSAVERLVIVGEPLRDYAGRMAGRHSHIEVVWNGVKPPEHQRAVPQPDTAPVALITVANLQEGKGVDLLLGALDRLAHAGVDHWHLSVIGEGPMGTELRRQVEDAGLGGKVRFLGPLTNAQVFAELARADMFVLPSYREAFGVAYLEAMATGLLTIGVEGQGPAQFITNGETGLLVAPRSVEALEQRLRPLLADADRTQWRGIAARGATFVRSEATWDAHARKMTDVAHAVLTLSVGHRAARAQSGSKQ